MIAASTVASKFSNIMHLASASGIAFVMVWHDEEYHVEIKPTGRKIPRKTPIRTKPTKTKVNIVLGDCLVCGGVLVSGHCTSKVCPTTKKAVAVAPKVK